MRREDLVPALLERLVRCAAHQCCRTARRADPGLVLPGDGLLAEHLRVNVALEGVQIHAAGGQDAACIVIPMAQQAQYDVVGADAVTPCARSFFASVAEDGLQVC